MKVFLFISKSHPLAQPYRTTLHDDGGVTCDCPARVECWHKKAVKSREIIGRQEYTVVSEEDRATIIQAVEEQEYYEGAVEHAFTLFPSMTRDEAVDLVEEILKRERYE